MTWLLSRITNNPMVIVYIAAACFAAGLASGAIPAWKVQGWRLDAVQARFDAFVAQTKTIGEQAQKAAQAKAEADQRNKERFDEQIKNELADSAEFSRRMLDSRSSRGYLPAARPGSGDPNRANFDRAKLNGAMGYLDARGSGIAGKGDAARIGLDTARGWVQGR